MGILDTPDLNIVQTDPTTQGLINQNVSQSARPTGAFANDINTNVNNSVGRLSGSGANNYANSGVSDGYKQALVNAYGGQTNKYMQNLNAENQITAEQRKAKAMQTASQLALHQQQTQNDNFQTLTSAYNQMEAQRAEFVAQISGLASYGIGRYAAAHPKPNQPTADQSMASSNQNMFGSNDYFKGNYQMQVAQPPQQSYLGDY